MPTNSVNARVVASAGRLRTSVSPIALSGTNLTHGLPWLSWRIARRTCDELEGEMAYVIVNDFEGGTREQYDATTAVVHPAGGLPPGQTHHYAGPSTNGWVVVAVWESKEIWEKFRDEALLPAFQGGGSVLPGPPKTTEFEVEVEL